jgi:hypothetical protein
MKNLTIFILVGGLLAGAVAVSAAPLAGTLQPSPSRPAPLVTVDPIKVLQTRVLRLERQVNALESTISKTQPALTFSCLDNTTSRNSVGVSEDCTPYACAPIDGRCRTTAKTTNDCAVGYYWIQGGGCVPG